VHENYYNADENPKGFAGVRREKQKSEKPVLAADLHKITASDTRPGRVQHRTMAGENFIKTQYHTLYYYARGYIIRRLTQTVAGSSSDRAASPVQQTRE